MTKDEPRAIAYYPGTVMRYDPDKHHRRSIRLKGYDYSQQGAYFVTLCAQNRETLFGDIVGKTLRLNDAGQMVAEEWLHLEDEFPFVETDAHVVMPNHFHGILVIVGDASVGANLVFAHHRGAGHQGDHKDLPNDDPAAANLALAHHRGAGHQGDHKDRPNKVRRPAGTLPGTLGRIIQAFKSRTTHAYIMGVRHKGWPQLSGRLWQRNYYEHIVRDEADLNRLREYIETNPLRWALDNLNPANPSEW